MRLDPKSHKSHIELLDKKDENDLIEAYSMSVDTILRNGRSCRNPLWTEAIAVGDEEFIQSAKMQLGAKATGRKLNETDSGFELKEPSNPYMHLFTPENDILSLENRHKWSLYPFDTIC